MKPYAIVGIGNLLLGDEGLGIHAVRELIKDDEITKKAEVYETGTRAFEVLECIDGKKKAVIIDAFRKGHEAGRIHRHVIKLEDLEIADPPITMHDINFIDALISAKGVYNLPEEIVVYGIEPCEIKVSLELSETVKKSLDKLIKLVKGELT